MMNTLINSSLLQNITFVRPEYFYISGFSEIPNSKYYFILFIFIYIIAVCGNSTVLFMIFTEKTLHSPKNLGIFNLALADFGETNALIPNMLKTFLSDSPYISYEACLANMFFCFFFVCGQTLTLTALAYDRFVAICLPLRYHAIVTHSFMTAVITAIWSFNAVVVSTMVGFITRLSFCKSNEVKSFFCDHGPVYKLACNDFSINYNLAFACIVIYLYVPLIAIFLSYLGIISALIRITTWEARLKALKTCASHLIVVGIFFLPSLGTYMAAITTLLHPNARIINTSISASIPPMLNPIIYVLSTKEFRGVIVKMFTKKSNINSQAQIFTI
ncbi:olfactory receptor 1M1-like [Trichomycterus rosablanca]|uniref:olfactory receptor 1M1-like n=1 Tax=Trichomycterus rosablanca TaxID=2290929 RepID=UPI002F35FC79